MKKRIDRKAARSKPRPVPPAVFAAAQVQGGVVNDESDADLLSLKHPQHNETLVRDR